MRRQPKEVRLAAAGTAARQELVEIVSERFRDQFGRDKRFLD
jgi:hypothetical protein